MRESKIKLEDVLLDAVVDENPNAAAEVTQKPVEKGQDISDYMKQKPLIIRLSGRCVKDAASKLQKLRNYQKDKKLLKYNGRGIYSNAVITELNTRHNSNNAFGFDFEITLTCVRIATPEAFQIKTRDPKGGSKEKSATKTRGKTKVGRQQLKTQSGTVTEIIKTPTTRAIKGNSKYKQENAGDAEPIFEKVARFYKMRNAIRNAKIDGMTSAAKRGGR